MIPRSEHDVTDDQEESGPAWEHARPHSSRAEQDEPEEERKATQKGKRAREAPSERGFHVRAGSPGHLDQNDARDERRARHAEHHPQDPRDAAPLGLGCVERDEGENQEHVGGEHRARSWHRAVFRIAAEVQHVADQQQDAGGGARQPASRSYEVP